MLRALLILCCATLGCSRPSFSEVEREFVTGLEHLEAIHRILNESRHPLVLSRNEKALDQHMAAFEVIHGKNYRLSFQLTVRLVQRYLPRLKAVWEGIDSRLRSDDLFWEHPVLLKVETWMKKMMEKPPQP